MLVDRENCGVCMRPSLDLRLLPQHSTTAEPRIDMVRPLGPSRVPAELCISFNIEK